MDNKKWFKNAKFGMFIHWGLYSLLAGEYNGKRSTGLAEWIQYNFKIPKEEYEKLAQAFNPIYFDAEEWVRLAKEAGMEYIVITGKHHDGFSLYKSDYDKFNVVDGSPFKRDIVKELHDACKKNRIKFGVYYSQELDWREENCGGYDNPTDHWETNWSNDWIYPDENKEYDKLLQTKIVAQVKEILTKYDDLCLIWFDCPRIITKRQSQQLYDLVKSVQPNCLVNSRNGNGICDYESLGDNLLPENPLDENVLAESPITLNDTWGFKYFDNNWKSADEILALKEKINSKGANMLLNVGPDYLGRIPVSTMEILKEIGSKLKK